MVRIRASLASVAALTLALAAPAGARQATVEGWDLSSTAKTCTMATTFSDDVTIELIWSPATSELGLMAMLPSASGAKAGGIEFAFDGDSPHTQWEDDRPAAVSGDESLGLIATWGAAYSAELAKTVAAASHVRVSVGGKLVGTYDLSGGAAAYRALLRCGRQIAAR